jgi:sulfur relay (sulfurtransferase) DsrF/TusC family protein
LGNSLLVIISSPPYTIGAVDGMLTVLGVQPKLGWAIRIFLVGDGVFLAKNGQNAIAGIYVGVAGAHNVPFHEVNFEKALCRLIHEGAMVYVSREDCEERGLGPSDLVANIDLSGYEALAREMIGSKTSFFF